MANERRRVPRYTAHLKASLVLAEKASVIAVVVEDLCVLGCLLEYAPSLQVYQECVLTLEWSGREFRTPATVAWNSRQGQAGLSFHDTDAPSQELLRKICGELRMKPLVRMAKDIR
jgi:hypothetical protein